MMLYKEDSDPMNLKHEIANRIIFQSTYQWFGNAVTPSWWTNMWINGGVAEYLKHYLVDKVKLQFTNFYRTCEYDTLRNMFAQTLDRAFCLDTWKLAV